MCEFGKCWKDDDPESTTGEKIHYPVNPRDSSFWLLALVREFVLGASIDS